MTWHHKKHDTSDHSFTSHNAPLPTTCNGYSLYRLFATQRGGQLRGCLEQIHDEVTCSLCSVPSH